MLASVQPEFGSDDEMSELSRVQGVRRRIAVLAFRRIVEIAQIGHRVGDLVGRYAIGARSVGGDQPASVVLPALEDEDRVDGPLVGLLSRKA